MQKTELLRNFLLENLELKSSKPITCKNPLIENSFHFIFDRVGEFFSWDLLHSALVVYAEDFEGERGILKEVASSQLSYSGILKTSSLKVMIMADLFHLPSSSDRGLHVVLIYYR